MNTVLITGVLGGVGSEMVGYLLKNTNDLVLGMIRRKAQINYQNINEYIDNPRFKIIWGDLTDSSNINEIIRIHKPDFIYNFAAFTHVQPSFEVPEMVYDINVLGLMRILDAVRKHKPTCRVYQAGSVEQIANSGDEILTEKSPLAARNFYGSSKNSAAELIKVYRQRYNLYAVNAINSNFEGPTRGNEFLPRKVTEGIAKIKKAIDKKEKIQTLKLGYLDAKRQWGSIHDMVDAAYKILNQDKFNANFEAPTDYLVASNELHSVREFVELTCFFAGLPFEWREIGLREYAISPPDFKSKIVEVSSEFYREETSFLLASSDKIRNELGWKPKYLFKDIIQEMVDFDLSNS